MFKKDREYQLTSLAENLNNRLTLDLSVLGLRLCPNWLRY